MKVKGTYKKITGILISLFLILGLFSFAQSAFNPEINYQGKLTDSANMAVADGDYNMEFKLYTVSSSGSALWTETLTLTNKVTVTNGLFSVLLGNVTSLSGIDFNQNLYLGVNIGGSGTASWDGEMTPRKQIASVPSAFEAGKLDGQEGSYYLDADNLTDFGNPFYTYFNATTTDALSEGASNFYWTADRFASSLAGTTTDALTVGLTNLYWTQDLWDKAITATSTLPTITTLTGLTTIGTIGAGVWEATDIGVEYGGTGASSFTDHGVLIGSGMGAITPLAVGTDGQLLVGFTGGDPVFATLNAGVNLTATLGAGTIQLDVDDAFLINSGDDITTGQLTALNFIASSATATSTFAGDVEVDGIAYFNDTIENGLVGWWSIDEGSGTNVADKSINGKNGTLTLVWVACGTSSVVDADGNTYETVEIGTQCWMAENLNVGTKITSCTGGYLGICTDGGDTVQNQTNNSTVEKYCYSDNDANCTAEGGLYQWDEAMQYTETAGTQGICPSGWHMPTDAEQNTLDQYLTAEGNTCDADRDGVWDCDPAGTSLKVGGSSGFEGRLSGYRRTSGAFYGLSSLANFWSSSVSGSNAWKRLLYSSYSTVHRNDDHQAYGFSVRCLKN